MSDNLRGVTVYDCVGCKGRGRLRGNRGICPNCSGRRVVIIQHGRVLTLTSEPAEPPARQLGERRAKPHVKEQRAANVICVNCGSQNLETDTLCADCLAKLNKRTRESNRRSRGSAKEIG